MATTLTRKAWNDLRRRRARSVLTVATIAIATASLGLLAVPDLLESTMDAEIANGRLYDVVIPVRGVDLDPAQVGELEAIPSVAGLEVRSSFATRVVVGDRREPVAIWGFDPAHQPVDVVHVTAGRAPASGAMEVLVDSVNARSRGLGVEVGDVIEVQAAGGSLESVEVVGTARSLAFSGGEGIGPPGAVFYALPSMVATLASSPAVSQIEIRLDRATTDPATGVEATDAVANNAAGNVVAAVTERLEEWEGSGAVSNLAIIREPGDWPGRVLIVQLVSMLTIVTALALGSAAFLVWNTMNTLVAEQTSEIGVLKALGGRRRQIRGVFLRTATVVGVVGGLVGAALGVGTSVVVARALAHALVGVAVPFGVVPAMVVMSFGVGVAATGLASLPALRRGLRIPVREALEGGVATSFGTGAVDRLTLRGRGLPRPVQVGVRNLVGQRRRSLSTIAQIGLAVAATLAMLGVGTSVLRALDESYAAYEWDLWFVSPAGAAPIDDDLIELVAATDGVARVDPVLLNSVGHGDASYEGWGVTPTALFGVNLKAGRWFVADEFAAAAPVVVIGPAVARSQGLGPGDAMEVDTAGGPVTLTVVGVETNQRGNGLSVFLPLATMQSLSGWGDAVNGLWVRTDHPDPALVDRVAITVEDRAVAAGYGLHTLKLHVMKADNVALNTSILSLIQILGLLIVAIGMVGLANALTMSVLERTREVGVLRCIGARARDIRRIFTAESVVLAVAGFAVGVPLGWVLNRVVVRLMLEVIGVETLALYPVVHLVGVAVATVVLAVLVVQLPVRRATRMHPGDALRYQ